MKGFKILSILVVLFCCNIIKAQAQIALQFNDTTLCPGQPLNMCAAFSGQVSGLAVDDRFTDTIKIGFPFTFFGNTYTMCTASDNNFVSFDITRANQHSNYQWFGPGSPAFSTGEVYNSICLGFLDAFLPESGVIRYQTFGNPGSRRCIIEWCKVAKYSGCSPNRFTNQVILYEGSNVIEIHTTDMPGTPTCPTTDAGRAVQGLISPGGTTTIYTPGRAPNDLWGATGGTNKVVRFTPTGPTTYDLDSTIAFNPWVIIPTANTSNLTWYAEGEPNLPIATGACASVITNTNTNYYVVKYDGGAGCDGGVQHFSDTVRIHFGTAYNTVTNEICAGTTFSWFGRNLFLAGNYDTVLKTARGCDSFLTLQLVVNPLPDVTLRNFSSQIGLCGSDSAVLAITNPEPTTTYQWSKDGNPISGATASKYTVMEPGRYDVKATTDKGCSLTSQTVNVTINPSPDINIKPLSGDVLCAYDTLELVALPGNIGTGDYYDYRWTPEKPFLYTTGPNGIKVKGIFLEPTMVTLTAYNKYGCYDSDSVLVQTKPCCEVFVPNAFSPNNDGLNDYFMPQLQNGQVLVSLQVFDRYGKLIYDNTNIKKGWDGRYPNGSEANADVYMFLVRYTCADGKLYEKKETVSLLR